ncbi:MAG: DUF5916 domain-containing protein [Saprospiraceae bacterium]|jgi:hypothetical protein
MVGRFLFGWIFISWTIFLTAQETNPTEPIKMVKTEEEIIPDGVLSEAVWETAKRVDGFWQSFPLDSIQAIGSTEVMFAYDDTYLYVAVISHTIGNDFVIPSLRRDYSFSGNDNITLVFDTFGDKTNAMVFGMNPYGVQREALISNGGRARPDFQSSWDNKWRGDASRHADYWIGEFAIPFKTLRFQKGSTNWRFNCYRSDTQINEQTSLNRIPRNRLVMDLSFMRDVIWEEPLEKAGTNVSIIPFVTTSGIRDYEDAYGSPEYKYSAGLDAKVGVTSGLNLDLTVNPDFSQVEVDQQVTNLDRFEIFFPERRQFFLENADLFSTFGIGSRANPFFSRRIGVVTDPETGQNLQNPIHFGARLSGKLNENVRVGLMNMQAAALPESGLPAFNYTVAAFQQKVFNRSNFSFFGINKQATGSVDGGNYNEFNRVIGAEYRLLSADNKWNAKVFLHKAITPEKLEHQWVHGSSIEYITRKFRAEWAHVQIGNGFVAEVGFIPRKDILLASPEAEIFFYPKSDKISFHSLMVDTRFFWQIGKDGNEIFDPWTLSERQVEAEWSFETNTRAQGGMTMVYNNLTLMNDFDPTRRQKEGVVLKAGDSFVFTEWAFNYRSDQRQTFFYEVEPRYGSFYSGFRTGVESQITYRFQPYGSIAMNVNYNYIDLKGDFEPASIWLVGPRFDLTFSKKIFLTTFVQYNNQLENLNVNARLQWRYAPVSDFFLVFTDNFNADGGFSQFSIRNRALVAKLTYWFNP